MKSAFSALHPFCLFAYYAVVVAFSMLFFHPVFLFSALVIMVGVNLITGTGRSLLRLAPFYLAGGLAIALLNPLISQRGEHIVIYLGDRPLTLESIVYGVTMMLSLLTVALAFMSYQRIVASDKLLFLLSSASPQFALLLMMTLRFLPLFKKRLGQIVAVQRTRGIDASAGAWNKRIAHAMRQLQVLLTMSMEEALQTADSMKARGYGLAKRTTYISHRMRAEDKTFLLVLAVLSAVCLTAWFFGSGRLTIYPDLQDMRIGAAQWWGYGSFCLTLAAPLWIEGWEKWRWRYCR